MKDVWLIVFNQCGSTHTVHWLVSERAPELPSGSSYFRDYEPSLRLQDGHEIFCRHVVCRNPGRADIVAVEPGFTRSRKIPSLTTSSTIVSPDESAINHQTESSFIF